MSFVLFIAFFITNTVTTSFASNGVSEKFYGHNSKKVSDGKLKVSITRGEQRKDGDDYAWEFDVYVKYMKPGVKQPERFTDNKYVESLTFTVQFDHVEQEDEKTQNRKKLLTNIYRKTALNSFVQEGYLGGHTLVSYKRESFDVRVNQNKYKPGSIRGRIDATLKMQNNPQYHRIEARTKSKFWYPWDESTWSSWMIKKNRKLKYFNSLIVTE